MMKQMALAIPILLLPSCAVFESQPVNLTQPGLVLSTKPGTMTYFLPTGRVHLQLTLDTAGSLTITTSVLYIPDLENTCLFRYQQSAFSDDQIKVSLTDNGLLSSVTSTTTDATPQIIQKLGELAVNTMKIIAAAGGGPAPGDFLAIDQVFDPLNPVDVAQLNQLLILIGVRLTVSPDGGSGSVARADSRYWAMKAHAPSSWEDGLLYRPALPYRLTFVSNPSSAQSVSGVNPPANLQMGTVSTTVALPNESPILAIEVSRAAFVSNSVTIAFNDGMLKEINYTKPSQAAGLVQIPVDLSKQLLSVPNDLLTLRYANVSTKTKAQTDQLNDQTALLKAQADLLAQQKALADAQEQAKKDAACKPDPTTGLKPPGCL